MRAWPEGTQACLNALNAVDEIADETVRKESIRQQAHALRGAAANYGFDRLASVAEQLRNTPNSDQHGPLIDALNTEAATAFAEIDAYVPDDAQAAPASMAS